VELATFRAKGFTEHRVMAPGPEPRWETKLKPNKLGFSLPTFQLKMRVVREKGERNLI
jgi:hypothetical protein